MRTRVFSKECIKNAIAGDATELVKFVEWEQPGVLIVKADYDWWRIAVDTDSDFFEAVPVKPVNKDVIVRVEPVYENVRCWEVTV